MAQALDEVRSDADADWESLDYNLRCLVFSEDFGLKSMRHLTFKKIFSNSRGEKEKKIAH